MKRIKKTPAAVVAAALAASIAGYYFTRDAGKVPLQPQPAARENETGFSEALLETANKMAALAETSDEQDRAHQAMHLADDELDVAFATALREAAAYRPPASGPSHDLIARIDQLKTQIAADQRAIAQLTKQASSNTAAGDQLQLAKARLTLDQDDLADAQQDLARQGGDPHGAVQRAVQAHESAAHQAKQPLKAASPAPTATLLQQIRAWFGLRETGERLLAAEHQAAGRQSALVNQHQQLEKQLTTSDPSATALESADSRIANLQRQSDERKTLAEIDQRVQDCQQLAGVYKSWRAEVDGRRRGVVHQLLGSVAEILAIVLLTLLVNLGIRQAFGQVDRRRLHNVRLVAGVAVQLAALALIALIIFGPPRQLSTIIGFATAGLTLALRDFILAFLGWFALMGRNGIRPGDWVEIEGVSGEVIEIGLFKTVLLELGNWTNSGYPTGRKVAFSNSFAIERHYFNFSTSGQWLWDEIQVILPAAGDPYQTAQRIRELVERETEADAAEAARDWERVTRQYGARSFSAKPAVNLRPSTNGLEVVVRYIIRAPQRHAMKSKLFQEIVEMLHKPARGEAERA